MMAINQISEGVRVNVSWMVKNDKGKVCYHWYAATVKKVHRLDKLYVVCYIVYDDGDENQSQIFWEKDHGDYWEIVSDEDNVSEDDDEDDDEDDKPAVEVVREKGLVCNIVDTTSISRSLSGIKWSAYISTTLLTAVYMPILIGMYGRFWMEWNKN